MAVMCVRTWSNSDVLLTLQRDGVGFQARVSICSSVGGLI